MSLKSMFIVGVTLLGMGCTIGEDSRTTDANFPIIGGQPAPPNAYPWTVALIHANESDNYSGQFCAGSVIDARWIVTAAHCVNGRDANALDIGVGMHDLSASQGVRIRAAQIIVHPDYNPATQDSDIALVRLSVPTNAPRIRLGLPPVMSTLSAGAALRVVGWGNTSTTGSAYPTVLHEVGVPFVPNAACNAPSAYGGQITDTMMCAGDMEDGGIDSCQGDSGGPLVVFHANQWHLVGIVSWGEGCAQPNRPGVYTRVREFVNWINEEISQQSHCRARPIYSYWNANLGDHLLSPTLFDELWGWSFSFEVGKVCQDQVAGTTALHSYWNPTEGVWDHFYSRDFAPDGVWGWQYEYVLGYVYQNNNAALNTRPLCRMWNGTVFDHHYYAPADGNCIPAIWGWSHERVEGYILP